MAEKPKPPVHRPAPKPPAPRPPLSTPDPEDPPARPLPIEDPPAAEPPRLARAGVKVQAIHDGYYGDKYRRTGDVFTLERGDRLGKWMQEVHADTPEHTTSHGEALQGVRQDVMTQRAIERGTAAGVQPAGIDTPDDGLDPIGAREG